MERREEYIYFGFLLTPYFSPILLLIPQVELHVANLAECGGMHL
jgi:hypothetical protein